MYIIIFMSYIGNIIFYHPAYIWGLKMRRNWNMQSLLPIFQCSHCHHNLYKVRYTISVVHTLHFLLFSFAGYVSDGFVSTQAIILQATLNHDLPSSHFVHIWNFMCHSLYIVLRRYKFPLSNNELCLIIFNVSFSSTFSIKHALL